MKKQIYQNRALENLQVNEEDSNVLTFSVASSEPYLKKGKQGPYYEVLEINDESVNFERLIDKRAPILLQHDDNQQIGVVESAFISDGKVNVTARFSKNPMPQEILNDIKDGIRKNVSIGYIIDDSVIVKDSAYQYPVELVKKFTILEASIVSIPADATVGIGRSMDEDDTEDNEDKKDCGSDEENKTSEKECGDDSEEKTEKTEETVEESKEDVCPECGHNPCTCEEDKKKACEEAEAEAKKSAEIEEIRSLGELMNCKELAEQFITENKSYGEFKDAVREYKNNNNTKLNVKENNNMSKFSIRKALLNAAGKMTNDEAAFEIGVIEENKRKFNITDADIVLSQKELRAFDGTEAMNQTVYQPGMYTPNLRPAVTVDAIGTKKVAVSGPSISFAVCTSGLNAGFVDINGNVPSATMTSELKTMTPKKEGAFVDISYQSLLQDDPSAEGIVMDDIVKALDQAKNTAFFNGVSGNNEPVGILNTTGINEVTLPATPALSTALEFEKKIRESYDYSPNLKWVMGTEAYYKWASTPYSAVEQNRMLLDPDTRKCIGYDVYLDATMPTSGVILGNFDEALEADFDGITIKVVEDKELARKQAIEIVAHRSLDFLCRRPKSFTKGV